MSKTTHCYDQKSKEALIAPGRRDPARRLCVRRTVADNAFSSGKGDGPQIGQRSLLWQITQSEAE
jgi:hypothetical protein